MFNFWEIDFVDGYSIAIKSTLPTDTPREVTVRHFNECEQLQSDIQQFGGKIVNAIPSTEEEVRLFYECSKIDSWPIID